MRADAQDTDEIHWQRQLPDGNRAAAWKARQKLHSAARAMLRAAALASRAHAGFYGARYEGEADAFLGRIAFEEALAGQDLAGQGSAPSRTDRAAPQRERGGPSEHGPPGGGGALTARVPVTDGRGGTRGGTAALYRALHAAREAVNQYRRSGAMEPFDAAVELGVSHELAEALQQLVRGTEGVRVSMAWSRAAGPPEGCPRRPSPVVFTPGDLAALQQAAQRYVREEPSVPVRLTGTVVRLRRAGPSGPGAVRLRVLAGAAVRQVRAGLDEEAYRIAVHAHLAGLPIRIGGRLESKGGFRRVTGTHGVAPVPAEGPARDRMLKKLGEGLDGFGRALAGGTVGGAGAGVAEAGASGGEPGPGGGQRG